MKWHSSPNICQFETVLMDILLKNTSKIYWKLRKTSWMRGREVKSSAFFESLRFEDGSASVFGSCVVPWDRREWRSEKEMMRRLVETRGPIYWQPAATTHVMSTFGQIRKWTTKWFINSSTFILFALFGFRSPIFFLELYNGPWF